MTDIRPRHYPHPVYVRLTACGRSRRSHVVVTEQIHHLTCQGCIRVATQAERPKDNETQA